MNFDVCLLVSLRSLRVEIYNMPTQSEIIRVGGAGLCFVVCKLSEHASSIWQVTRNVASLSEMEIWQIPEVKPITVCSAMIDIDRGTKVRWVMGSFAPPTINYWTNRFNKSHVVPTDMLKEIRTHVIPRWIHWPGMQWNALLQTTI